MLNLIRMDVARMRRMKSLFWVPFLLCAILFLEVFSTKQLYERMNDLSEVASSMDIELNDATEQELKTMNDKLDLKIDVLDSFGELLPSNVFALYLAIFTVLYSCADFTTGFIKTIGGQVKRRSQLVASKLAGLFVFEVFLFAVAFAVYTLLSIFFFKGVTFNDPSHFLGYFGIQLILHFCLMCFCAMVCIVARNGLVGMVISLITVLGFFTLLSMLINKLISSLMDKVVHVEEYLIMENITRFDYNSTGDSVTALTALTICGITAAISIILSCLSMEKRDVI